MIAVMPPTQEWLRSELGRAILAACEYEGDRVLIDRDSSERSIMFRIGRYLAPVIEDCHPRHLWVDLEYNRVAGATDAEEQGEEGAERPEPPEGGKFGFS
jgi:hypothetical protein